MTLGGIVFVVAIGAIVVVVGHKLQNRERKNLFRFERRLEEGKIRN